MCEIYNQLFACVIGKHLPVVKTGAFSLVIRSKKFNITGIESWSYGRSDISRVKTAT